MSSNCCHSGVAKGNNDQLLLLLICAVGLLLRLAYGLWLGPEFLFPDEGRYWCQISNLLQEGTLHCKSVFAHDMPLTSLVAAGFLKVSHSGVVGLRLFFAILSAATIYLIAQLATLFSSSRRTPLVAAAVAACYPYFVFYSSLILSETLFLFLFCGYFLVLLPGKKRRSWYVGMLGGLCHLTRPTLIYFFPIIWIWQYFFAGFSWKQIFVGIILLVLVILPWGIRNSLQIGSFLVSTSSSGHVLWEGNNPWNTSGGVSRPEWGYQEKMPNYPNELDRDAWEKEQAVSYIRANPVLFVKMSFEKFLRFWHLWPNDPGYDHGLYRVASLLSFVPVLFFALLSIWILRKQWRQTILIWSFMGYYTLLHMVTIGSIRYRLPLEILLIVLASATVVTLVEGKNDRSIEAAVS